MLYLFELFQICAFAEDDLGLAFVLLFASGSHRFESCYPVRHQPHSASVYARKDWWLEIALLWQQELDQIDDLCALSFLRGVTTPSSNSAIQLWKTAGIGPAPVLEFTDAMNLGSKPPFLLVKSE